MSLPLPVIVVGEVNDGFRTCVLWHRATLFVVNPVLRAVRVDIESQRVTVE